MAGRAPPDTATRARSSCAAVVAGREDVRTPAVPSPTRLLATRPAVQRCWQPETVGQLNQQCHAGVPDQPLTIGGDVEPCPRLGSLHPQGALLDWDRDLQQAAFSQLNEGTFASPPRPLRAFTKTPG
jgi:hypothetical protein